jgi:hypothetical protein
VAIFTTPSTCSAPSLVLPKDERIPVIDALTGFLTPAAPNNWWNADASDDSDCIFTLLALSTKNHPAAVDEYHSGK